MQHDTQPVFDDAAREKAGRDRGRGPRSGRPWLKAAGTPEDQKTGSTAATRPDDSPAGRVGQLSPSLASLVANPSSASEVPVERIPALVAELASEQSALSALQGALTVRLLVSQADAATRPETSDRLMTAEEVATALGVTPRWVQRRARRLPFARRISDHAIRYSESGLRRWMSNRKLSAA
jgi:predicted DNA-binding transcriptional regulator AlpA